MINLQNTPYLSLDKYLDIDYLNKITDDIIVGIARSRYAAGPGNSGPGYLDLNRQSVFEIYKSIMSNPTHEYYALLKSMKNWEPYTFIQYKWPGHILGQVIVLRSSGFNNYTNKGVASQCNDFPAMSHFSALNNFVAEEDIFSSIGRVVIFLNEPRSPTLPHRDYADGISRNDEFIWLSPLQNKKFYIIKDNTKHYVNSKVCYFNNAEIHGADAVDISTFSIRIDGVFSDTFKKRVQIDEHNSYFNN